MEHRHRYTLAEKQYVKGMVRNLSLQRWSDTEITQYLNTEKSMQISRASVTTIKNQIEKEAEKWYIELKQSRYKFLAMYKERLDSLLSYQKTLSDIVTTTKKEENKIRAIAALQSIESDIFNIFKQLPEVRIEQIEKEPEERHPDQNPEPEEVWGDGTEERTTIPIAMETTTTTTKPSPNTKEKEEDYVWKLE